MSVEVDFTQANQGFQDGGGQVFWTIGSDHRLYRIELRPGRGAIAIPYPAKPADAGAQCQR
jgi:hypothetical protein